MTRKERRNVVEGTAIIAALTMLVLFVMPAMINSRESVAFVIAVLMGVGGFGWLVYFIYRISGETQ